MSDRQLSKEELFTLLGNCVITLTLAQDERLLVLAKAGAEKHLAELNERFPEWEDEIHSVARQIEKLI